MRRPTPLLLLACLAACSSYQGTMAVAKLPTPIDPTDRYEFWSHGEGHQLHAVRVVGDSIAGVPWWKDPACDSCRVTLARAEIDSVRTPQIDGNKTGALATVAIPFIVVPVLTLMLLEILGMGPGD